MSPEAAPIAEHQRQLSALAELSLVMAQDAQAASSSAANTIEFARITEAFCKAGRCMRMCIALSMRLSRPERIAPARQARPLDLDLDAELDAELDEDLDDWDDDDFDEPLERETLYDRLPSGDVPTQIAAVARTLASAAKAFPGPLAERYRARCEALAAESVAALPNTGSPLRRPDSGTVILLDRAPTRSRGPPGRD